MNQFPPSPRVRGDIRKSRCTTAINNNGGKIATGINDIGGKFASDVNDTGGKQCEQLPNC
jgi:hypothetical protein